MSKLKPFVNLGPGDTIREELEYAGWEQKDLAEIMGRTEKNISQLITNKAPVTYETACQLSKIFKQSVQFWLNLDANYRQRLEESAKVVDTEAKALIYRYMPVRELRRYIDLPRKTEDLIAAVKRFWGMDELNFAFLETQAQACFRKSEAYRNFNPYYALSWLQLARSSLGGHRPKASYDPDRLASLADTLSDYTIAPDGITAFIKELNRCGVVFMQIDHFQQTYVDGASFIDNGRPVIIYTARHNRNDNFWFTMAHELGHVLLHADDQGTVFIDSLDHLDLSDRREEEADAFAEKILHSQAILQAFQNVKRPSVARVERVAAELGLHPAVVAGALQHHGKASWTSFHELKEPVRTILPTATRLAS
jgi:HTH-type transcriptional regulator/antitoxin HigA